MLFIMIVWMTRILYDCWGKLDVCSMFLMMFFNFVVIVVYIVDVLCYIDIDQFEDKLMIELLGELGEGQLLGFNVFRFDAFQKQVLFL